MKKIELVYQCLKDLEQKHQGGVSAYELSEAVKMDRTNISRYLNQLCEENKLKKHPGRPVLYSSIAGKAEKEAVKVNQGQYSFSSLALAHSSLQIPISQGKAAILYPPRGLHTLILGETGVGKSMFAELMFGFAKESGVISQEAPFITFNCADYAENPQLILAQIFGVKKGAYTGADRDRDGLLKKADGGMLFLDEVHRLSPQGQEMLFTFIDKGCFEPLGATEGQVFSSVQIIAATTEAPESYLLNTFTRRIPMIIKLPSLKDRGLSERFSLVEGFIRQESKRIGKSIYINKDVLIAFLLYDCPNNIGQLKSDIQLACARAFANYKSKNEDYILVAYGDLPAHVKSGLMKMSDKRFDLELLIKTKDDVIRYNHSDTHIQEYFMPALDNEDFYDVIESRINVLKASGVKDEEIGPVVNIDIDSHFRKYMGNLRDRIRRNKLSTVVNPESVELAKDILSLAGRRLNRPYDEKTHLGLAFHLQGFADRIKRGGKVFHPRLNLIRVDYPEEFIVAMEAARLLDERLKIHTPFDEIGYITMFLAEDPLDLAMEESARVGVLVGMHGNSTATSMAEAANSIVGSDYAQAFDMPLSMSTQMAYELLKETIMKLDKGRGVLLLADMGALLDMGSMVREETGIVVKTIEMTSTPIVIDACRKALMGRDIYSIYEDAKKRFVDNKKSKLQNKAGKPNAIITACFTGEGASSKLRDIILSSLEVKDKVEIIPMEIMNRREFQLKLSQQEEAYTILAVVSTIDIELDGDVLFIPALDILAGDKLKLLEDIIQGEEAYGAIAQSLSKHIQAVDSERLLQEVRRSLGDMERTLGLRIRNEVKIGILLHMCFMMDKLYSGGIETPFKDLNSYKDQYNRELMIVCEHLRELGKSFGIAIGENESAYICKMLISNNAD